MKISQDGNTAYLLMMSNSEDFVAVGNGKNYTVLYILKSKMSEKSAGNYI